MKNKSQITKTLISNHDFMEDTKKLIQNIIDAHPEIDPKTTAIIAIGRGGFVPAQYTAYALGIQSVYSISSSLYDTEDSKKKVHRIQGVYNIPYENYKTIIVIDDLRDSGTTIDNVMLTLMNTASATANDSLDADMPTFIAGVVYTHVSKKKMRKLNVHFGKKIKKVNGNRPWLVFPWDLLMESYLDEGTEDLNEVN